MALPTLVGKHPNNKSRLDTVTGEEPTPNPSLSGRGMCSPPRCGEGLGVGFFGVKAEGNLVEIISPFRFPFPAKVGRAYNLYPDGALRFISSRN